MSGWHGLLTILQERAPTLPGAECPNDGTRLRTGPQGQLYCPFDGWRGPAEQAEANAGGRVTGYGVGYYGISPYGV